MEGNSRNTGRKITGILLGLIGIALVLYFILFKERAEFNSDYTDTLVWAKAALDGNGIFSSDFVYAYLLPFSGNLIMMPFVAYLGVTYEAQAFGMAAFALLFLLTAYALFRVCGRESRVFWICGIIWRPTVCVTDYQNDILWTRNSLFFGAYVHLCGPCDYFQAH